MTILLKSEFIWPIQCACYIYQMQFWVTSLLHLHLLFIWHFFCVRTWYIQSYPNIWFAVWTACQTPMCFEWQNPQSNDGTKIIICFKQEESLYFKNVNFCFTKREKNQPGLYWRQQSQQHHWHRYRPEVEINHTYSISMWSIWCAS